MKITQIRFAPGYTPANRKGGEKYRHYTAIRSFKTMPDSGMNNGETVNRYFHIPPVLSRIILTITLLTSVCAMSAQRGDYGINNIHFNESTSRPLTAAEIEILVTDLWSAIPDHGINDNTRAGLTQSFYALVEESFIVPTDNPGGIGSEEFLLYWYSGEDSDYSDHISRIETISKTSSKVTAKVTYVNLNTPAEHTIVLVKEDGNWKVDDFDSKRREMQEYTNNARNVFSAGLHRQMMQQPEYAQHFSPADRQKYIDEVEYYLDRYVRMPQTVAHKSGGQQSVKSPQTQTAAGPSYARPHLAEVLDKVVDQYPEDVKIFENPLLRDRLIALMGESRFNIMLQNFQYTYPIEKSRNRYLIMGCKRNKCGITDFEIQYNPHSNNLCIKYNVDGNTEVFMDEAVKIHWHEYIDE